MYNTVIPHFLQRIVRFPRRSCQWSFLWLCGLEPFAWPENDYHFILNARQDDFFLSKNHRISSKGARDVCLWASVRLLDVWRLTSECCCKLHLPHTCQISNFSHVAQVLTLALLHPSGCWPKIIQHHTTQFLFFEGMVVYVFLGSSWFFLPF